MYVNSVAQTSVRVGEFELLAFGTVHVEGAQPISVALANLKFVFEFREDDKGPRYAGKNLPDGSLLIELFNHKNSLGEGKLTPVLVGQVNGRPLSFTYFTHLVAPDTLARRFEFAFYLGIAQ
jgi:hypothetical protein